MSSRIGRREAIFGYGPGAVRRLLEFGVSPTETSGLFLTHLHHDHCVDFAHFSLLRLDQGVGRILELAIWGPAPLARMTEALLGPEGAFSPDLAARTEHPGSHFMYEIRGGVMPRRRPAPITAEVAHGDVVAGRGWTVQVAEVIHMHCPTAVSGLSAGGRVRGDCLWRRYRAGCSADGVGTGGGCVIAHVPFCEWGDCRPAID